MGPDPRPKEEKDEKRDNSEQQNVSETARSTANLGAYFTCRKILIPTAIACH